MSYQIGRVYRIISYSNPTFNYVGSTFDSLRNRWQGHKSAYLTNKGGMSFFKYFDETGINDYKILLIKEYKVVDRTHLEAYEQLWINKIKCINMNNPFRISYLSQKHYAYKNKSYLSNYKKDYSKMNKEKIKKYQKEYQQIHKDIIAEREKQTYICPCSVKPLTMKKRVRHEMTIKHLTFLDRMSKNDI